jgi:hypothetical protein
MDDADRHEQGASADDTGEIVSRYEVVPYGKPPEEGDLYAFRSAMPPPPPPAPPPTPAQQAAANRKHIALMSGIAGLGVLLIVLIVVLFATRQEPYPPFIDLGANSIASAGLGGRLIAKWDGKAEYELRIDPLVPQQIAEFSTMAGNPPRPLSVDIRMKDAFGSPLCEKQILLPFDSAVQADPAQAQPLLPQKTQDGDAIQNVAGSDGRITEIVINGQLLCPLKLYKRLASWDISSTFPSVADQGEWMRHEEGVEGNLRQRAADARARALIPRTHALPAPIEGDDVIVYDNPSKGTVETKSGRLFYVGRDGLRRRAPAWQVFPAAIHFRCDTKAACTLTRADASASLAARLVH